MCVDETMAARTLTSATATPCTAGSVHSVRLVRVRRASRATGAPVSSRPDVTNATLPRRLVERRDVRDGNDDHDVVIWVAQGALSVADCSLLKIDPELISEMLNFSWLIGLDDIESWTEIDSKPIMVAVLHLRS